MLMIYLDTPKDWENLPVLKLDKYILIIYKDILLAKWLLSGKFQFVRVFIQSTIVVTNAGSLLLIFRDLCRDAAPGMLQT